MISRKNIAVVFMILVSFLMIACEPQVSSYTVTIKHTGGELTCQKRS